MHLWVSTQFWGPEAKPTWAGSPSNPRNSGVLPLPVSATCFRRWVHCCGSHCSLNTSLTEVFGQQHLNIAHKIDCRPRQSTTSWCTSGTQQSYGKACRANLSAGQVALTLRKSTYPCQIEHCESSIILKPALACEQVIISKMINSHQQWVASKSCSTACSSLQLSSASSHLWGGSCPAPLVQQYEEHKHWCA